MNKQEALNKLAALEAETKALRAIIEAPDKPAPPTRWRPEKDHHYQYVVCRDGTIDLIKNGAKEYAHGNCFQTRDQAEIAAKAVSVTLKLCAAAFTVDPDAGEFTGTVRRYSVYRTSDGSFGSSGYPDGMGKQIYVHTFEQAKEMAAILNAEGV
jgi:hypothetical protein